MFTSPHILWFADLDTRDSAFVGKAGTHLGSLYQAGFPIAPGFIITSHAYFDFLKQHRLDSKIQKLLTTVNFEHPESVMQVSTHIKKMLHDHPLSEKFTQELRKFYARLGMVPVSINGYSLIKGTPKYFTQKTDQIHDLIQRTKDVWAEHFTANLLMHRHEHTLDHTGTGSVIIIQSQTHPEKEGKVLTLDLQTHAKDKLFITHTSPQGDDTYTLSKKTLSILERQLRHHLHSPKLTHDELLEIGILARELEAHHYFPLEISWGFEKGEIVILGLKPYTKLQPTHTTLKKRLPIARGISISPTIATGLAKLITRTQDLKSVKKDDIIVIANLTPGQIKHLKHAKGIITERGEKHSEVAALVHRLGIPAIFEVKDALKTLKDKTLITIHAGKGEIYQGDFH